MEPDHRMLDFGRRAWVWVPILILLGLVLRAVAAPGFQVVGTLSATDTEKDEQMVALGQDVILIVRDKAVFDRQIAPLIGQGVELTLVAK